MEDCKAVHRCETVRNATVSTSSVCTHTNDFLQSNTYSLSQGQQHPDLLSEMGYDTVEDFEPVFHCDMVCNLSLSASGSRTQTSEFAKNSTCMCHKDISIGT